MEPRVCSKVPANPVGLLQMRTEDQLESGLQYLGRSDSQASSPTVVFTASSLAGGDWRVQP